MIRGIQLICTDLICVGNMKGCFSLLTLILISGVLLLSVAWITSFFFPLWNRIQSNSIYIFHSLYSFNNHISMNSPTINQRKQTKELLWTNFSSYWLFSLFIFLVFKFLILVYMFRLWAVATGRLSL